MRRRLLGEHFKHDGTPKRDYGSREAALAAMVRDAKASTYHCKFCGGWHVAGVADPKVREDRKRNSKSGRRPAAAG